VMQSWGTTAVSFRLYVQRNASGMWMPVAMLTALVRRYVPADEEIPSRLCIRNIILGHTVCRPVGRMLFRSDNKYIYLR
jgi:hypothetical protein